MKMKTIFALAAIAFLSACSSYDYAVEKDSSGKNIIVGEISWSDWKELARWGDYSAPGYQPSKEDMFEFRKQIMDSDAKFLLFSATWCSDSESETPKIFKLFEESRLSTDRIRLIGVDRNKRDNKKLSARYHIEKVPTLVILVDDEERGRIVEYPELRWEVDIIVALRRPAFPNK